jgi:hypothetical protein
LHDPGAGALGDSPVWQGKYLDDQGKVVVVQLRFWLSALP